MAETTAQPAPTRTKYNYRKYKCKECGAVFNTDVQVSNCVSCGKKYPKEPKITEDPQVETEEPK